MLQRNWSARKYFGQISNSVVSNIRKINLIIFIRYKKAIFDVQRLNAWNTTPENIKCTLYYIYRSGLSDLTNVTWEEEHPAEFPGGGLFIYQIRLCE